MTQDGTAMTRNQHAARDTDKKNIKAQADTTPEMNLEQCTAQGLALRMVYPAFKC